MLELLLGVCEGRWGVDGLEKNPRSRVNLGEFSGDSEGNEVSDLSVVPVVGVVAAETAEFLRDLTRTVPDL